MPLAPLSRLRAMRHAALDFLFTPRCAGCRREGCYLCDACAAATGSLRGPIFPWAATGSRACFLDDVTLAAVFAPHPFTGAVREAVHDLKYRGVAASAPELAARMAAHALRHGLTADVIAPVPLHQRRHRRRGYNQAALLAREVSRLLDVPLLDDALVRTQYRSPQAAASSKEERASAVRDAFRCDVPLSGRRVLLIDDVCTTGATLNACACALRAADGGSVIGLTLAHEV